MQIGELILKYRSQHNLSQRQFAKKCGDISNGYISMLENNLNPATNKSITPTIDKLRLIAHGMDMSLDDLFKVVDDTLVSLNQDSKKKRKVAQVQETVCNDDEIWELRETMRRDPNMRVLFSTARNATPKQLKQAIAVLEALKASDGFED